MQQIRKFILALLALALGFASCDSKRGRGDLIEEDRSVDAFHQLDVSVPGKVIVHIGATPAVHVQAEENVMPYLKTEVHDGELRIFLSRPMHDIDDLVITVTATNLDAVDLSGSGNIVCAEPISGQALKADVSGSGDLALSDVDFDVIETRVSGSGEIILQGQAQELKATVSGSGNLHAEDCPVVNADVNVSGSGNLYCNVSGLLKVNVSGSGDVRYRGQPLLDLHVSGSGEVKPL